MIFHPLKIGSQENYIFNKKDIQKLQPNFTINYRNKSISGFSRAASHILHSCRDCRYIVDKESRSAKTNNELLCKYHYNFNNSTSITRKYTKVTLYRYLYYSVLIANNRLTLHLAPNYRNS